MFKIEEMELPERVTVRKKDNQRSEEKYCHITKTTATINRKDAGLAFYINTTADHPPPQMIDALRHA